MGKINILGDIHIQQLLDLCITTEINEHGTTCFTGIISEDEKENLLQNPVRFITISYEEDLRDETDVIVLFAGQIQKYTLKGEDGIYTIKAECLSSSVEFDKEKRFRSFQNTEMTYSNLFREISGKGRTILAIKNKYKKLSYPMIQYEETDWEFIKRMAGQMNAIIVPDVCHLYPQIAIGAVHGKTYELKNLECYDYEMVSKIEDTQKDQKIMLPMLSLEMNENKDIQLCDYFLCQGNLWMVLKKEIKYVKGELICKYWGGKEQLKIPNVFFNHNLCGLRLCGKVVRVVGEKIKVQLDIDKENGSQAYFLFPYLPVTGNGMYAMPEVGSTIYLYFPDNNEKNVFLIDCLPFKNKKDEIAEHRFWEILGKKEMAFLPKEWSISTKSHMAKMMDTRNLKIGSEGLLKMCAKGKIILNSEGFAFFNGEMSIHSEYNGGSVDYIHMEGVECAIKAKHFWSSDLARKAQNMKKINLETIWRAKELTKTVLPKVIGAIPSSVVNGIGGKVLGGIPGCGSNIKDLDISVAIGVVEGKEN